MSVHLLPSRPLSQRQDLQFEIAFEDRDQRPQEPNNLNWASVDVYDYEKYEDEDVDESGSDYGRIFATNHLENSEGKRRVEVLIPAESLPPVRNGHELALSILVTSDKDHEIVKFYTISTLQGKTVTIIFENDNVDIKITSKQFKQVAANPNNS